MTYQECKDIITNLKSQIDISLFSEGSTLDKISSQLVNLSNTVNDLNEHVNILEKI